jgi:hypothetical protein
MVILDPSATKFHLSMAAKRTAILSAKAAPGSCARD